MKRSNSNHVGFALLVAASLVLLGAGISRAEADSEAAEKVTIPETAEGIWITGVPR